jgi:RNA polymerase sigma factor (sigma-70 family)
VTEDIHLLAEYVQTRSEAAFTQIVSRHIRLVYSTAARLLAGNQTQAEDVVQIVFSDLARKAHRIPRGTVLSGWLYRHASFTSLKLLRTERRRSHREREAWSMIAPSDENDWLKIVPILDDILQKLGRNDRDALLLRFFENQDFRAIGETIGATEDAARKRVSRAVEEVRRLLLQRGVTVSTAVLGTYLSTNALAAVPSALISSTVSASVAAAITTAPSILNLLSFMSMTKSKFAIATVVVAAGVGTPLLLQQQTVNQLKEENAAWRDRPVVTTTAPQSSTSNTEPALPSAQFVELLRLRNEVAMLRRLSNQWHQTQKASVATAQAQRRETPAGTPLAAEQWADVGTRTPEAAAQTLLFALKSKNSNRVSEVLTWNVVGEQDQRLQDIQQHHVRLMERFAGGLKNFTVQPEDAAGKENLTVRFEGTGTSGQRMQAEVPMTRRGDEWLIAGQIENLGSTANGVKVRVSVPFVGPNRGSEGEEP